LKLTPEVVKFPKRRANIRHYFDFSQFLDEKIKKKRIFATFLGHIATYSRVFSSILSLSFSDL